ncbi:MAG: methyltransferase domain-containing protein [Cyclobacteriaceae bacterium]
MKEDLYGQALLDYAAGKEKSLYLETSYGTREEMPVSHYFRDYDGLPDIDQIALQFCSGNILDVGAGAGVHSLILQENNNTVTALELSPGACQVMKKNGVQNVLNADFYTLTKRKFDTILLLMNGLGLAGTLNNLPVFLSKAKSLLSEDGVILVDSSDIRYLYEEEGVRWPQEGYYGEISYRYIYGGKTGDWFPWLYADADTLEKYAGQAGLDCNVIFTDDNDQYLARLYRP